MSKSEGETLVVTVIRRAIEFSKIRISFETLRVIAVKCVSSAGWEEE